jgi:tRNA (guanine6-N2)-methyltransferase
MPAPRKSRRPASRRTSPRRQGPRHPEPARHYCEAEVIEGLEEIARQEIAVLLSKRVELRRPAGDQPGIIRFTYTGGLRALLRFRTVQAVYTVHRFDIPRPRSLLGDEHMRRLLGEIAAVRAVHPPEAFQSLHISAAGAESSVMLRLRDLLAERTGLRPDADEGDLVLRLRRMASRPGWEVLLRISPRPLATRPWRVCNMEGALNATLAHAMILMTDPTPHDVFLNLACGSGTLLVERLNYAPARQALGCDTNPETLDCARQNIAAAGLANRAQLHDWDARALPLPDASVDALCADLPFGHLVGSHEENLTLYPAIINEAGRVARPGGLAVIISHEIRLMESLLEDSPLWDSLAALRVNQGGLNPRIFVLRRRA